MVVQVDVKVRCFVFEFKDYKISEYRGFDFFIFLGQIMSFTMAGKKEVKSEVQELGFE